MDPETFKNIAQGVQAISIAIAAIAGGGWAVFKLYTSKELDKSRIAAISAKKEFEKRQGITGYIEVETGSVLSHGSIPVFLQVVLHNESSETHTLNWKKFPLRIASVVKREGEYYNYQLSPKIKLVHAYIAPEDSETYWSTHLSTTLLPNSKKYQNFYWECPTPGIYQACISTKMPDSITRYMSDSDEDGSFLRISEEIKNKSGKDNYPEVSFVVTKYFQICKPGKSM